MDGSMMDLTMDMAIPQEREFAFTDAHFDFLAGLANRKTGIVLAANKKDMVYGRLVRRLRALRLPGFDDYCRLLQSSSGNEEMGQLVNAVTTNLTRFYREPHHFEALGNQLRQLVAQGKKRIRIWSAGCSSGMEPYSIAMTIDAMRQELGPCDIRILATDIDTAMLDTASAGIYSADDVGTIPDKYHKYIEATAKPGQRRMADALRGMITFNHLNLLEEWPIRGQFDVIFCRNVVIYFDKETKQTLFDRLADQLDPDGLLYIGHSENLHGVSDRFELVGRTIYRRTS